MSTLRAFKAALFRTLGNPLRIEILEELRRAGQLTVGELHTRTGAGPSNVSQHLAIMRSNGVVIARRDGNNIWYSIAEPAVLQLLDAARTIFERETTSRTRALAEDDTGAGAARHEPQR